MKATLLFAALSMVFAMPEVSAMTELEALRAKCKEQESQIQRLEEQVGKLRPAGSEPLAAGGKSQVIATVPAKSTVPANSAATAGCTVRPGDTFERIARRSRCSATELAKVNGLQLSSIIRPGQKLKLPGSAVAKTNPVPADTAQAAAPSQTPALGQTHKIQEGETYSSISRKHKVSVESLIAANPGVRPTELRSGQVIRLSPGENSATVAPLALATPAERSAPLAAAAPPPRTAVPFTPFATKRPAVPTPSTSANRPAAPEKAPEIPAENASHEETLSPNPEQKIRAVTIKGEMTYGEFAASHGTDTGRLNDLNGLDLTNATVLAKGSELYIPAQP